MKTRKQDRTDERDGFKKKVGLWASRLRVKPKQVRVAPSARGVDEVRSGRGILVHGDDTRFVGLIEFGARDQDVDGARGPGESARGFLVCRVVSLHDDPEAIMGERPAAVSRRNAIQIADSVGQPGGSRAILPAVP